MRADIHKTDAVIHRETAEKWLARALACREKYTHTGQITWLVRAKGFADEALEHAALAGDNTLAKVRVKLRGKKGRW